MTDLNTNILGVVGSSREPLTVEDIADALKVFDYHRTSKLATVNVKQVQAAVEQLQKERAILPVGDGFIVRRSAPVEEKQLQLF